MINSKEKTTHNDSAVSMMELVNYIRQAYIVNKEKGDKIPSETELIKLAEISMRREVSRSPMRRALEYLRDVGDLVVEEKRKGHIVQYGKFEDLKLKSDLKPLNRQFTISQFLIDDKVDGIEVDDKIIRLLEMPIRETPITFKSIRFLEKKNSDGTITKRPGVMTTHFVNPEGIDKDKLFKSLKEKPSLSAALKSQGKKWRRFSTGIKSRLPSPEEQRILKIGEFDPVIEASGLNMHCDHQIKTKKPVELSKSVFPGHWWDLIFYFHSNELPSIFIPD